MTARRRFDVVFAETIAKHGGSPGDAEDVFARSGDDRCVAVCDGASVSFDSRTWATVLAQAFAADPPQETDVLTRAWIAGVAARYRADAEREDWSWAQEEAYRLGSFSTLLGVRACERHDGVHLVAVGDSVAVLVDGDRRRESFPYTGASEFTLNPDLCSTVDRHNVAGPDGNLKRAKTDYWSLSGMAEPILLCMTDALAEWALGRKAEPVADGETGVWTRLCALRTQEELLAMVNEEQVARRMRQDDVTLVVIVARGIDERG